MKMRGDYVMLRADALRLLLPQREVTATEYIEHAPMPTDRPGVHALPMPDGGRQEVVALSAQLLPLDDFPPDRFLLTRLGGAQGGIAVAWNEVRVLIDTELEFHALPAIMRGERDLIDAYVELGGELVLCTTSRVLPAALQHPE